MIDAAMDVARMATQMRADEQLNTRKKADGSTLTDADSAAETIIREKLGSAFPDVQFLGEESADMAKWLATDRKGEYWVVDPIDGTTNFATRRGAWAVSIAHQVDGLTKDAVVFVSTDKGDACNGYIFWATKGAGTRVARVEKGEMARDSIRVNADKLGKDVQSMRMGFFAPDFKNGKYIPGVKPTGIANAAMKQHLVGIKQLPVQCACADALGMLVNRTAEEADKKGEFHIGADGYTHGVHYPWDSAASFLLLAEAGYKPVELEVLTDPGMSAMFVTRNPQLTSELSEDYRSQAVVIDKKLGFDIEPPLTPNGQSLTEKRIRSRFSA